MILTHQTGSQKDTYQRCSRCVMDTSANEISFDRSGICNYCTEFIHNYKTAYLGNANYKSNKLSTLVNTIKRRGRNKKYDCIVGVSGGVDSSWTLSEVVKLGLRPLAVHMDNGWNSELAQNNISNLVTSLNVDLYTHVINWNEYRSLLKAFFDADVIDIELLYDNALLAVNYKLASKFGVNYILAGTNQSTEGMKIPSAWNWYKFDKRNIYSIARKSGITKFKTFPSISTLDYLLYHLIRRIKWVSFLDYLPYNKEYSIQSLKSEFGFKPYSGKHFESILTRFYQGYLLPRKFGIDKRIVHLSTLIITEQITRYDAIEILKTDPYPSKVELENDILYFNKKMKYINQELAEYIKRPQVLHSSFQTEISYRNLIRNIYMALPSKFSQWLRFKFLGN